MKSLEELNEKIRACFKCRLSETRMNALRGEGNANSKLMLIAQAPGENEDREGRMFIGPSGKKLDGLLKEANVDRSEIYMTNLIKCMLPKYRKPKEDEIQSCSQYLNKEIELVNPDVIVPLGYYSTRYIIKKYNIPLPKSKREFSRLYGRLLWANGRKVYPLRHPTALIFNEGIEKKMVKNYRKLKTLLVDCKWYLACPLKRFYEEGKLDEKWIELYCKGDWESCIRYQLEGKGEPHQDRMLPDGSLDKKLK
ncbi:MAG TPA: uracil-DNA glycosylase [Thermoplasmata archaeon]|nr:uracil-DNA glycosylase [Thermoplasmata archaeon]